MASRRTNTSTGCGVSIAEQPSSKLSERLYQRILPRVDYLPEQAQRQWLYFKLWPNVAFDIYPDQIDFMQFLPVSPTRTLIREINYAIPDERREMKAARYLNWRINRQVNAEDTALITRVQQGMMSSSFSRGPLGAKRSVPAQLLSKDASADSRSAKR